MITPHHWIQMLNLVPEDFKQIVSLCFEYEELIKHYEYAYEITGSDISKMQILMQSIMTEYMKIVSYNEKDEKILGSIKTDMYSTLSNWFDATGRIRNLATEFVMSMERGQLNFHLPLFATPSSGFNHSRIYWSLIEAYKTCEEDLPKKLKVEELGKFVPDKDWVSLSKKMFPRLCLACRDFEEYANHLFRISPLYNGVLEEKLQIRCEKVIKEYLKIVRSNDTVVNQIRSIVDFIAFVNSLYYYIEIAKIKRDAQFLNVFVTSTKNKAGIYPEVRREDRELKLPPLKVEED